MTWIYLLGYAVIAVLWAGIVLRVRPQWFLEKRSFLKDGHRGYFHTYHAFLAAWKDAEKSAPWQWRKKDDGGASWDSLFVAAILWPVMTFVVLGSLLSQAVITGLNTTEATRTILERDLATAKAEIEELLRTKP